MPKITILITEDHSLLRETWRWIFNQDQRFEVIGECGTGEEAVEFVKRIRPDVVLMDINMPGMNGIRATELIRNYSPSSKVLGISLHNQPAYARKMMKSGASGYLTKNSPRAEMYQAIAQVHEGKKYICEEIKEILSNQVMNNEAQQAGLTILSEREMEVVELIKQGLSSKEISEHLQISVKTVEVHRYNILRKLKLKNAAALVNYINKSALN